MFLLNCTKLGCHITLQQGICINHNNNAHDLRQLIR